MGPKKRVSSEPEPPVKRLRRGSDKVDEEYTINGKLLFWTNVNILHKKTEYEIMWPAFKTSQPPEEFVKKLKKNKDGILLKFFNIKQYELVNPKESETVVNYEDCKKKSGKFDKLVQDGLDSLCSNEIDLTRFIRDVCFAEKIFSGLTETQVKELEKKLRSKVKKPKEEKKITSVKKPSYADIFKKPESTVVTPPREVSSPPKPTKLASPKKATPAKNKNATKLNKSISNEKFSCPVCNFGSDRVNALTMHMKTHTAEEVAQSKISEKVAGSGTPSPKKQRVTKRSKQEQKVEEEKRKEEIEKQRISILDDWTDDKAAEDKKKMDVTSIFDRLMESKKISESPQSTQENEEDTKENGESDQEDLDRSDDDAADYGSDCESPDYTMRASNISDEDRGSSPVESEKNMEIPIEETQEKNTETKEKDTDAKMSCNLQEEAQSVLLDSSQPQLIKENNSVDDTPKSDELCTNNNTTMLSTQSDEPDEACEETKTTVSDIAPVVIDDVPKEELIMSSSITPVHKVAADVANSSAQSVPGSHNPPESVEQKPQSASNGTTNSDSPVPTDITPSTTPTTKSEEIAKLQEQTPVFTTELPGPSPDSGKKSKPTATIKPTMDSSMLQQALQGEIKSSPTKEKNAQAEEKVCEEVSLDLIMFKAFQLQNV